MSVKLFPPLLATKIRDFHLIKAYPSAPRRITVALEVFVHESKKAATAVVEVDLDTLATTLVGEVAGASVDYVLDGAWHGVLQRDAVIELAAGKRATVTKAKLGKSKTTYQPELNAIARSKGVTYVSGRRMHQGYAIGGFVAKVASGARPVRP